MRSLNLPVDAGALGDAPDSLYEHLNARFRAPLMAFFLKRVWDRCEAEDLTQEVFLRLIARAGPLQFGTTSGYVFTVAVNLLRDRARRAASRQLPLHQSLDDRRNVAARADLIDEIGPERVLLGRESLRILMGALRELDAQTRNIFILFRIEKMSQRDIAALYGLSIHAVERRVAKATAHLVARLKTASAEKQ